MCYDSKECEDFCQETDWDDDREGWDWPIFEDDDPVEDAPLDDVWSAGPYEACDQ